MCSLVLSDFVMINNIYKYPRLYLNARFKENGEIVLESDHAHYLRAVLRKSVGDYLRVFNGSDGEWVARISELGKKKGAAECVEQVKAQSSVLRRVHLFFSPIKKQRMDFLIEKAVELGVTDLHPVLMNRTESRKINKDRIAAQVIEAAEQCERMDVPVLHDMVKLPVAVSECVGLDFYAALERDDGAMPLSSFGYAGDCGFIIGPEGGFDEAERAFLLAEPHTKAVSLGEGILRAETAVISCLAYAKLSTAGA